MLFAASEYILVAKVSGTNETVGSLGLIVNAPTTYIVKSIGENVALTGLDLNMEVKCCGEQYVIPVANNLFAIHQTRIVAMGIGKDEE